MRCKRFQSHTPETATVSTFAQVKLQTNDKDGSKSKYVAAVAKRNVATLLRASLESFRSAPSSNV